MTMRYEVTSGEINVGSLNIESVASSSMVMIGDTREVFLFSIFEGPPEDLIAGVTIPFTPPHSSE